MVRHLGGGGVCTQCGHSAGTVGRVFFWGGGAIKAWVCRLVLVGVCTCSPFDLLRREPSARLTPTAGGKKFSSVRVGQLSLCSYVLLLPLGIPPMPALAHSMQNLSQYSGVWRVLATTDLGNATQGQGCQNPICYPSVYFFAS